MGRHLLLGTDDLDALLLHACITTWTMLSSLTVVTCFRCLAFLSLKIFSRKDRCACVSVRAYDQDEALDPRGYNHRPIDVLFDDTCASGSVAGTCIRVSGLCVLLNGELVTREGLKAEIRVVPWLERAAY